MIKNTFRSGLNIDIFTTEELKKLNGLQGEYAKNIANISNTEYAKELERLAIDLSINRAYDKFPFNENYLI